ncbi:MAG TPA: YbaB/EbfC family nucleoid-associated protein [Pirellulales bacterium]|nr:YbaB/EbfC family nucleoid-associated protein [Pirellulales bacterium]
MFGQLGNLASMIRQAQQIGGRLEGLNETLRAKRANGSAGGGLVEVEVNGLQEVLACRIDPGLFAQGDRELIEDLVRGATNDAIAKARQFHADAMKELMGGADLPGLNEALAKLTGGGAANG